MYLENLTGVVHEKHQQLLALTSRQFMTLDDSFMKSAADQCPVVNLKVQTAGRNSTLSRAQANVDSAVKIKPDMLGCKCAQKGLPASEDDRLLVELLWS